MVVADHAGNFPCAIFVSPQMNESPFAHSFGVVMPRMMKAVNTHLDCAVALHGIDLQRFRHEFSRDLAADIFLRAVGQCSFAQRHSTLIVIELHIFVDERGERF
jgi:hypothetical protein